MSVAGVVRDAGIGEQRRWPRYQISVPVIVLIRREDKTVLANGRGTELNEGGLAVFVSAELAIDEEVEISFTPPYNNTPIEVRCAVRNRQGYIYGLEFLEGKAEDAQRVEQIRNVLRAIGLPK
ncbi:MAG: PilZ domain-containing protein [Candidatus Korobacteraceae bacterium]